MKKNFYDLRAKFLEKKALTEVMKGARDLSPEERPTFGKLINEVKTSIDSRLHKLQLSTLSVCRSHSVKKLN